MKRVFVKAVLMLLVLVLPAVACGQTVRQTVTENGRIRETLVTFAEAPQAIRDLMNGHGLGDARCVCGAALEQEAMAGSTDIAGLPWTSSALMVVERGGAYALVGLRCESEGRNARVEDFACRWARGVPCIPCGMRTRGFAALSCCFLRRAESGAGASAATRSADGRPWSIRIRMAGARFLPGMER